MSTLQHRPTRRISDELISLVQTYSDQATAPTDVIRSAIAGALVRALVVEHGESTLDGLSLVVTGLPPRATFVATEVPRDVHLTAHEWHAEMARAATTAVFDVSLDAETRQVVRTECVAFHTERAEWHQTAAEEHDDAPTDKLSTPTEIRDRYELLERCPDHVLTQHRDGCLPWCDKCGLDAVGMVPVSNLRVPRDSHQA